MSTVLPPGGGRIPIRKLGLAALIAALISSCTLTQGPVFASGPLADRIGIETVNGRPTWSKHDCPVTCVVVENEGGLISAFRRQAQQLKAEGRTLMIDGVCASACTMAADIARPNVCITDRAVLEFHRAFVWDGTGKFRRREDAYEEYSKDIGAWIRKHGGFPGATEDDQTMLKMSAPEAGRFFRKCKDTSA